MLGRPLSASTVLILGAGAAMPYQFPSGQGLLQEARALDAAALASVVGTELNDLIVKFQDAVAGTLDRSLDAMLELRPDLVEPGKAFMARSLLQREQKAGRINATPPGAWYEILWDAFDLRSLDSFRATPVTILTYNYDRSLEYSLIRSLQERFQASAQECGAALDCVGPIHLHGQLGQLPSLAGSPDEIVEYGGSASSPTPTDCLRAAKGIRIVHEANPMDEAFVRARDAISSAKRVVFLGFGYARQNIERLRLDTCMKKGTELYLCLRGYTEAQQFALILPQFQPWSLHGRGTEHEDIVQFLRRFPSALQ